MTYHQGQSWTTIDSDNDIALSNCALSHRGAWWYKNCHLANLNGNWGDNGHSMVSDIDEYVMEAEIFISDKTHKTRLRRHIKSRYY